MSALRLEVLGRGEISEVLGVRSGGMASWVYKRMPPFPDEASVRRYREVFESYGRALTRELGCALPRQRLLAAPDGRGAWRLYIAQERVDPASLGHRLARTAGDEACRVLFDAILERLGAVARNNRDKPEGKVGVDAQLSNWAWPASARPDSRPALYYLDTSTPLMRIQGREQLDAEVFLSTTPPLIRGILRRFFLAQVLDRYYDARLAALDLVANLHKEGLPERIPAFIETANAWIAGPMADFAWAPLSRDEVDRYYRNDARIWRLFQLGRRVDRSIRCALGRD